MYVIISCKEAVNEGDTELNTFISQNVDYITTFSVLLIHHLCIVSVGVFQVVYVQSFIEGKFLKFFLCAFLFKKALKFCSVQGWPRRKFCNCTYHFLVSG